MYKEAEHLPSFRIFCHHSFHIFIFFSLFTYLSSFTKCGACSLFSWSDTILHSIASNGRPKGLITAPFSSRKGWNILGNARPLSRIPTHIAPVEKQSRNGCNYQVKDQPLFANVWSISPSIAIYYSLGFFAIIQALRGIDAIEDQMGNISSL